MNQNIKKEISDTMSRNPSNWRGPIYFNKKDTRIFVPKLYPGLGYTLNFGNVFTLIILAGLILALIAVGYLSKS